MACLDASCQTTFEPSVSEDHTPSLLSRPDRSGLPPRTAVYRYDSAALSYGEHWRIHPCGRILGAWWGKLSGSGSDRAARIVHVEDHRAIEIANTDVPAEANSGIWPVLEEFLELGFCDLRFTSHLDPFNRLEITAAYAVHPGASTVLRISHIRHRDGAASAKVDVVLVSVFPDGSTLVTANDRAKLSSPHSEKRQGREGAGPAELWSMHTGQLTAIPHRPKAAMNADAGWELINEVEAETARFNLARGVYAKRSLVESANDEARLVGGGTEFDPSCDPEPLNVNTGRWSGALVAFAWLVGVAAFIVTICMVSIQDKRAPSPPAAVASSKSDQTDSALSKPAPQAAPQPRFVARAAPGLRDAE